MGYQAVFNCYKCYQTILSVLSVIRQFLNVSMCFQVLSDSFRCFKCFFKHHQTVLSVLGVFKCLSVNRQFLSDCKCYQAVFNCDKCYQTVLSVFKH